MTGSGFNLGIWGGLDVLYTDNDNPNPAAAWRGPKSVNRATESDCFANITLKGKYEIFTTRPQRRKHHGTIR